MYKRIYDEIYDYTNKNMAKAGKEMPLSKDMFFYGMTKNDSLVNIDELREVKNEEFLDKAYMSLLNRKPDESILEVFDLSYGNIDVLKNEILSSILSSDEFARNNIKAIGVLESRIEEPKETQIKTVDLSEILNVDYSEFLNIAYKNLLNRQPDETVSKTVNYKKLKKSLKYRKSFLLGIVKSEEFESLNVKVKNLDLILS